MRHEDEDVKSKNFKVLKDLEGQLVVRTKPVRTLPDGTEVRDTAFTMEPIDIVHVTDTHVIYRIYDPFNLNITKEVLHLLNDNYIDENWLSYDCLMDVALDKLVNRINKSREASTGNQDNKVENNAVQTTVRPRRGGRKKGTKNKPKIKE